ncbi:phosphoribosyltransferase family protein [Staphylococcus aureus]
MEEKFNAVVTIPTKGISLANAVANILNLPVVVIRKDDKVTEGSTVFTELITFRIFKKNRNNGTFKENFSRKFKCFSCR